MKATGKSLLFKTKFIEVATLECMMSFHRGNKSQCAKELNITRNSFRKYLEETPGKLVKVVRGEDTSIKTFELM